MLQMLAPWNFLTSTTETAVEGHGSITSQRAGPDSSESFRLPQQKLMLRRAGRGPGSPQPGQGETATAPAHPSYRGGAPGGE